MDAGAADGSLAAPFNRWGIVKVRIQAIGTARKETKEVFFFASRCLILYHFRESTLCFLSIEQV